ncbi:hypothetical protein EC973_007057, partial [Apophysomyces ossiformis]
MKFLSIPFLFAILSLALAKPLYRIGYSLGGYYYAPIGSKDMLSLIASFARHDPDIVNKLYYCDQDPAQNISEALANSEPIDLQ